MALAEFILDKVEPILEEWEKFAATMPQGSGMSRKALRDEAGRILRQIAEDMCKPETPEQQETKSKSWVPAARREAGDIAAAHARERRQAGFDLNEMVAEYRALRATVVRLWTRDMDRADSETLYELTRFNEALDETWVEAVARYSDELNRSRELLLGILGHDLRTPLSAVLMSARFMLDYGDLNDPSANATARILHSAKHIEEMISALLDVTRMRLGGSLSMQCRPADLKEVSRQVVDEIRAAHPKREIRCATKGDLQGSWDSDRLAQMLSNLLANAIQHGAADRPISLSACDAGDEVLVRVHNQGEPIPEAATRRLFEPMLQTEPEAAKPKGLGLGLYIVRAIVEAHGGRIDLDSSREQGTTFGVHLPRKPASEHLTATLP